MHFRVLLKVAAREKIDGRSIYVEKLILIVSKIIEHPCTLNVGLLLFVMAVYALS